MAHIRCLAVVMLVTGGLAGCLLDTEAVNHRPEITVMGPTTITRGKPAAFVAAARDADQSADSLSVSWHHARGSQACPGSLEDADSPDSEQEGARFELTVDFIDALCVWAVVKDSHGAAAFATVNTKVTNLSPTPVITVAMPAAPPAGGLYRLYSAFVISGAKSTDPDGAPDGRDLTLSWLLTRPNGAPESAGACAAPATGICFVAALPGDYVIALDARDALGAEGKTSVTVTVDEDRPPCIRDATPPLLDQLVRPADQKLRFEVLSIDDDGDPYDPLTPASTGLGTFGWEWRRVGDPDFTRSPVTATSKSPVFELSPDTFLIGDVAEIRVKYEDRVRRDFSACNEQNATCELDARRDCHQWVTWRVAFKN